ncbi:MAG: CCA tRNA nucleotidyltransferase [Clostridia bacterium]|nr:CCA tRNA nucleotidyltransferase [Clostridia bacterium]
MYEILPQDLKLLAEVLPAPIFAVGGFTRNYLIDKTASSDIDIAGSIPTEEILSAAEKCGFIKIAEYKRTGTAVIGKDGVKFEYTRFRTDSYFKGEHTPKSTEFTDDIKKDASRRDFKCNAVYYDIKNRKFVDPLGGVSDIKNRVLDTVKSPDEVFCSDGLRLMRLARFSGELNFRPTARVISSARSFADNIKDISAERIYEELKKILVSDTAYPFSDKAGHYTALKILDETRVLDNIFPELTLGRGMAQRKDFHKYDVLEHTLKTVLYAPKTVRLAALLHDAGKPYCMANYGKFHGHDKAGKEIAEKILLRLKADKKTVKEVAFLTEFHMLDMNGDVREGKLRKFIAEHYDRIYKLIALKQADFSAGKDDTGVCPTVTKWKGIIGKMKKDGTPFSVKELKISAGDLKVSGIEGEDLGKTLKYLWKLAVNDPKLNEKGKLFRLAENFARRK